MNTNTNEEIFLEHGSIKRFGNRFVPSKRIPIDVIKKGDDIQYWTHPGSNHNLISREEFHKLADFVIEYGEFLKTL